MPSNTTNQSGQRAISMAKMLDHWQAHSVWAALFRTKLAVLDWNENVGRHVATDKAGTEIVRYVHPPPIAWRAKIAYVKRSKKFIQDTVL